MDTHGVFLIKDGDFIWGFHMLADGGNIKTFYDNNKYLSDFQTIFKNALEYFSEDGYDDRSYLNFFKKKFDYTEEYVHWTHYTAYFDGERWHNDWEIKTI